jgi:lipopolysaccharide/colanic/teichoic acid biosynthesis glycosyltransferase
MYKALIKPFFDFIFALIGLLLLSPFLILATIKLFIANQGKPSFFHLRPVKNELLFKIIKFKTMNEKNKMLSFF